MSATLAPLLGNSARIAKVSGVLLGLAITVALGYVAVRDVDLRTFRATLAQSNYLWLAPALIALAGGVWLRAVRWRLLFDPGSRPPMNGVISALLIGYFVNQLLPARAGEAARIVALHQDCGTSRAEAAGTAVTERIYDVLSLLLLLFVVSPLLPDVAWIQRAAIVALVCALAVVGMVAGVVRYKERPVAFLLRGLTIVPGFSRDRTDAAAVSLVQGLGALHRPKLAVPALAATAASWFVLAVAFWCALKAVQLGLGLGAGLLVVIATNLALVLPSGPAGVGVFEAAVVLALDPFGVGGSEAFAAAVVLHAFNLFPFLLAGVWAIHRHAASARKRARMAGATTT